MNKEFLSSIQAQPNSYRGILADNVLLRRSQHGQWAFGLETIAAARRFFLQTDTDDSRIAVGLVNEPSLTSTWYKLPGPEDQFVIGINVGLLDTLALIAYDVFGHGAEKDDEPLQLGHLDGLASERISKRIAGFLETGFPLGEEGAAPSPRRKPFVTALVEDAMQFLVLHEFSHILLAHDRGDINVLRHKMVDLQIATFSIGQEHQADRLAIRLHASMRRASANKFPGLEFCGPVLFFGVLGIFERYTRYQAAFDTPHAHPNAYERLYRLRVYFSSGDSHVYWPVPEGNNFKLARKNLTPNPVAVRFSDEVARAMLDALQELEAKQSLPSPFNQLFNDYCSNESNDELSEQFFKEVARWLFLGSPLRVLQHLAEAHDYARDNLNRLRLIENRNDDYEADVKFLSRSQVLIEYALPRIRSISDYSVQSALRRTGLA